MNQFIKSSPWIISVLAVSGCVILPTAPSVMVLPGTNRTFEQFRIDDANCRQYAYLQIGGVSPSQVAANQAIQSAVVGTAVGAAAGAAIGGGTGAAIGAGSGLAVGSLAGTQSADTSGYYAQERYDINYIQCMYAQGHRVPVSGQFTTDIQPQIPQADANIPPPPPGSPPPPPSH